VRAILITAAIICEYNPFHNGHKYHIEETRRMTNSEYIIAIMSGNYVQRGEPAFLDKWARCKMALEEGADLVLELPSIFSCASAEYFASGAIDMINKTGSVQYLSFGSESGDLEALQDTADKLQNETVEYKNLLKNALKQGKSFPAARQQALGISRAGPNDVLALEYMVSLQKSRGTTTPITIKRQGSDYQAVSLSGKMSSATAIRNSLSEGDTLISETMPTNAYDILLAEIACGRAPVKLENFEFYIITALRRLGPTGIKTLPFVSEGLEYRIYEGACKFTALSELLKFCTSLRYTETRIRRILTALLTGVSAELLDHYKSGPMVPYLKVLGIKDCAFPLMKNINKNSAVPIINCPGRDIGKLDNDGTALLLLEKTATDIYCMGYPNTKMRTAGQEFTRKLVRI